MAGFGACYPCFKKNGAEHGVVLGKMVKGDTTVNFAEGKLYADNTLAEQVSEFKDGTTALETDDIADEVAGEIYGCKVTNKKVTYGKDDSAPLGCLAYYQTVIKDGVKSFRGYYFPKVKAALGNNSVQTKGDSITFQTSTTNFTVFADDTGTWREVEGFDTEAEARQFVETKCDIDTTGTGGA